MSSPETMLLERSVVAAILSDPDNISKVADILRPESFSLATHQEIYAAAVSVFERGGLVDLLTVTEELRKSGKLKPIGGDSKVTEIAIDPTASTTYAIETHARIIAERHVVREIHQLGVELTNKAQTGVADPFDILDFAQTKLISLSGGIQISKPEHISQMLYRYLDKVDKVTSGAQEVRNSTKTGYRDLDLHLGGFDPTRLYIVAGRPSQGKSALAWCIADNIAKNEAVAYFSLEMSKDNLMTRQLARYTGISFDDLKSAKLRPDQVDKVTHAAQTIHTENLVVDDEGRMSLSALMAKTKRMVVEHNIKGIFVDYLQLMQVPRHARSRDEGVGYLSQGLKTLAKELKIWVVAISSLSRKTEERSDRRPTLSDLRESGSIEYDADVVMFVYRPEMYGIQVSNGRDTRGLAYVIVGKNRDGGTPDIEMRYDGPRTTFMDATYNVAPAPKPARMPLREDELGF